MAAATSGPTSPVRPRVGIVKFASCDGCQLTLLDLEDRLLEIADRFEIVDFPEASSTRSEGPFDVLLVEGSVSTAWQADRIVDLRRRTKVLVTIGACAGAGGIQALRNWASHDAWRRAIYPRPEYVESLATSTPISSHVTVDAELRGCPIDPGQLVELLTALLVGRRPQLPDIAVCEECKRRGAVCVVVSAGLPCLGPLTRAGCGAICPAFGRGCYGCFGPRSQVNLRALDRVLDAQGRSGDEKGRLFAGFTAWAPPFRDRVTDWVGAPPRSTGGGDAPDR